MTGALNLLKNNRDFRLLWISQVLSQSGNRMFQIAVVWWILNIGRSNPGTDIAIFMVLGALPSILLVKKIGKIIDTHSSRKVLLSSDFLGSIVAILLAICFSFDFMTFEVLFVSSFLFSTFQGFIEPTLNKSVPELVEKDSIEHAVAFISSTTTLASFAGAICGAILIEKLGIINIIWLNGMSYVLSAICDSLIKFKYAKQIETTKGTEKKSAEKMVTGWKILDNFSTIKKLLIGFAFVNFFGTPILIILPIYTKKILNGSALTLGLLEAAIWLGILLGTFSSNIFGLKDKPIHFLAICIFSFGLFLGLPSLIINSFFYGFCLFLAGYSLGIMNVRLISFFQQIIPQEIKGRFFSLLQAVISFMVPLGYFTFGALTDYITASYMCFIQGLGVMILSLYYFSIRKNKLTE